ncbi:3004_t:CDS:1, partial [Funneliformis caledonium]
MTGRLNSLGGHDPNSPTFSRRPRGNSDASSIDIKRSDIDPALL